MPPERAERAVRGIARDHQAALDGDPGELAIAGGDERRETARVADRAGELDHPEVPDRPLRALEETPGHPEAAGGESTEGEGVTVGPAGKHRDAARGGSPGEAPETMGGGEHSPGADQHPAAAGAAPTAEVAAEMADGRPGEAPRVDLLHTAVARAHHGEVGGFGRRLEPQELGQTHGPPPPAGSAPASKVQVAGS